MHYGNGKVAISRCKIITLDAIATSFIKRASWQYNKKLISRTSGRAPHGRRGGGSRMLRGLTFPFWKRQKVEK